MIKIFRPRRRLWLARLTPAAMRFTKNAARPSERGIAVPAIVESVWVDRPKAVSACIYNPLSGEPLVAYFRRSPDACMAEIPALARFIRRLHRQGIYFRSLHPGNVILMPDRNFGLIDFLDLRLKRFPLSPRLARRNLEHFKNFLTRHKLQGFPFERLLAHYARDLE
jgi:hypothetical protein